MGSTGLNYRLPVRVCWFYYPIGVQTLHVEILTRVGPINMVRIFLMEVLIIGIALMSLLHSWVRRLLHDLLILDWIKRVLLPPSSKLVEIDALAVNGPVGYG